MYWVYIVRCRDQTLYTGITIDLRRRVVEHNTLPRGAKYTRSRRPVILAYQQKYRTRSAALRAEAWIKSLPRNEKLRYIRTVKRPPRRKT